MEVHESQIKERCRMCRGMGSIQLRPFGVGFPCTLCKGTGKCLKEENSFDYILNTYLTKNEETIQQAAGGT